MSRYDLIDVYRTTRYSPFIVTDNTPVLYHKKGVVYLDIPMHIGANNALDLRALGADKSEKKVVLVPDLLPFIARRGQRIQCTSIEATDVDDKVLVCGEHFPVNRWVARVHTNEWFETDDSTSYGRKRHMAYGAEENGTIRLLCDTNLVNDGWHIPELFEA